MRWLNLSLCVVLMVGSALAASGPVAVVVEEVDVKDRAVSKADAASLLERFEAALNGTGRFVVVPSGDRAEARVTPVVSRSITGYTFGARIAYWGAREGQVQHYDWPFDRYLQAMEGMAGFANEMAGKIPEVKQKKAGRLIWILLGVAAAIGGSVAGRGAGDSGGGVSPPSDGGAPEPGGAPDLPTPPGRP